MAAKAKTNDRLSRGTKADAEANRDPLSGEHGAHPVGTGLGAAAGGAAAGAATGAAIGTAAGPVGTALGAAVGVAAGAIVGGLAGKAVAESINPTIEHEFWRTNYSDRPYVRSGEAYEDYSPAYQTGWESQARYDDKPFDQAEAELEREWDEARGQSTLDWDRAKPAVRDAWERARQRRLAQRRDEAAQSHDTE